jgi:D-serine deaminase-like pyridoxal phosphate-dependent protein
MIDRLRDEPRYREVLEHLGERESLARLATPALVCDLERFDRNLTRMADATARAGVALRPHVKSHKSSYVARRQLDAGAVGLSFAKLSEAEAVLEELARESTGRISSLITSPLVGASLAARAVELAARCDLIVVVDAVDGVRELATCAQSHDGVISLLCDVDVGLGRTGVANADGALRIVEEIARHPQLRFVGVQGYGGQLQHLVGRDARRSATVAATDRLAAVVAAIESHGVEVTLRTGGGTGTAQMDIEIGLLNELQCGSYIFMDREYRDALGEDVEGRFEQSLFVATTVISANQVNFVTVDAGLKAMATDAGPALVEGHDTATFGFFGDEQGLVAPGPNDTFRRGQRLLLVPPHCDPTVDRYDVMWLVRGDVVEAVVDVTSRGCSQ